MRGPREDSRSDQVEPWPVWLRGTLLAVVVVVIGIGVVVALYDRGWLPLTGPFVAALLVPLILRGRHYWLARRRRARSAEEADPRTKARPQGGRADRDASADPARPHVTIDRLDRLLAALRQERARPVAVRDTGAQDRALDGAIDKVERARDALADGERDAAGTLLAEVAHHVVDSWSSTSALSTEVVGCSQALRR